MKLNDVVTVDKMRVVDSKSKVKAFVDVLVCGALVIKGFRVVDGTKGLFVGMPREKGKKEGEFFDIAYPINNDAREYLTTLILEYYEENKDKVTKEKKDGRRKEKSGE